MEMRETVTWNNFPASKPERGKLVEVIYEDGMQCRATWHGGGIWFPEGSTMYRFVAVKMWRTT